MEIYSAEQWGVASKDGVTVCVHGAFPPPIGMEREDRCEQTDLGTWLVLEGIHGTVNTFDLE